MWIDRLVRLTDVPQSSIGAPLPHVFASETKVRLLFLIEVVDSSWDGTWVRVIDADSSEPVAVVTFELPYATSLGPPNDEALAGHPLADNGLEPYSAYRVEESSWIAELCRRNEVHPNHRPETFASLQHFVFVFHDSTFDCVAKAMTVEVTDGSDLRSVLRTLLDAPS